MSLHGKRRNCAWSQGIRSRPRSRQSKDQRNLQTSTPTDIKGIRSFLGHAGFYRRFIKDFSKIARPLTKLLEKDTPFEFDDACHNAFKLLKEKLTCAPVIISPNWNLPFELMCDASDFAVGAILAYKTPTGTTPYKLVYVKNCHLPFEIEHRAYWALKNCNPDLIAPGEKQIFQLHELDKFRHQAYKNSRLYKARTKVWHDRKLKMRKEFKHGNKVLLFHSKYKFKQSKLISRWLGPYVVKHQYISGYVELYGKDGKTFIVNGHRLKLYHEEEDYNDQREAVTPFFLKE
ncbi:reverse transcriptase domain-containing protein [Tanacetum coccineum]